MLKDNDTIVVSSDENGFDTVFCNNQWYALSINQKSMNKFKYLAIYRKAPISGITHVAEIASIQPYKDIYHKYIVYFKPNSIQKLPKIILKDEGKIGLRNTIYTNYDNLFTCSYLSELKER